MRIIGCLLIIGFLFSYVPAFPMDDCPEGNQTGNMETDCGYIFHCPLVFNVNIPDPLPLPLNGRLILTTSLIKVDELANLIFHPPD
jgi:hypothetical protein